MKERTTILLAASKTGKKLKHLMISKSANPRHFQIHALELGDDQPLESQFKQKGWVQSKSIS